MNTLKVYGAIGVLAVGAYGVSMADRSMNYTETGARITAVETDCYVEAGRTKLVEKDTERMAYMDCRLAPIAAEMNDMSADDVKYRSKVSFIYTSPVDGQVHNGKHTVSNAGKDAYQKNGVINIYAHNEEAEKYRWN